MKRFVVAILFVVVAIVVLMGFYRKPTSGVKTSVSEVGDPGTQITHEAPPVGEEAAESSKAFSENSRALMPVDSNARILAR